MENQEKQLTSDGVFEVADQRFLRMFDLRYRTDSHYYIATRRKQNDLVALKSKEEFGKMLPDAVGCVVILDIAGREPLLYLAREFRYPTGQFLLGVPAGLIDPADRDASEPLFETAKRELSEETGLTFEETDSISLINPFLFSSPGMTDESNAMVQIILKRDTMPAFSSEGALGGECFDGFCLLTKKEALELLKGGRDADGIYYSVYTWIALMTFVSDIW